MEDRPGGILAWWKISRVEDWPGGRLAGWKVCWVEGVPGWKICQVEDVPVEEKLGWKISWVEDVCQPFLINPLIKGKTVILLDILSSSLYNTGQCKWLGIPTYATLEEPLACYVSKVFSLLPDKHRSKKDPAKIRLSYLLPI